MSVAYVDDISQGSGFTVLLRLLARWKGSLYKLVWVDLTLYLTIYFIINLLYRFVLNPEQKEAFKVFVSYCDGISGQLPVSFVLGFFVSGVIRRWFSTFMYIPWLNSIAYSVMSAVNCADPRVSRKIRLTVMRYLNLAWILSMRLVSDRVAERFNQREQPADDRTAPGDYHLKRSRDRLWSVSQLPNPKTPGSRKSRSLKITPMDNDTNNSDVFTFAEGTEAFEGEDEWSIARTLRSFNNDKKIQETFGALILECEIKAFERIARGHFLKTRQRYIPEPWIPIQWAVRLVQKAGLHANIADPKIIYEVLKFEVWMCSLGSEYRRLITANKTVSFPNSAPQSKSLGNAAPPVTPVPSSEIEVAPLSRKEIGKFRQQLQKLQVYSSLTMPLVYTQVAVISVYSYFICQIIGSQYVEINGTLTIASHSNALPVPIFGVFYFLFLMGWLKVALCVMNPFGDDYEDFECSEMLDYNLDVSYRAVLLDESTFPDSLKRATFQAKPMAGAEDDNLQEFLENTTREIQAAYSNEEINDIKNLEIKQSLFARIRRFCHPSHNREILLNRNVPGTRPPNPLNY